MTSRYQKRLNYERNKQQQAAEHEWRGLYATDAMEAALNDPHPKIKGRTLYDYYQWLWTHDYADRIPVDLRKLRSADPSPLNRDELRKAWDTSEMVFPGPERDRWPLADLDDNELRSHYGL